MGAVLHEYIPVLILFTFAVGFIGVTFIASALLGRRRATSVKSEPYECGMTPFHEANRRISVRYYMVAISFVIFDMETMLLLPWALTFRSEAVAQSLNWTMGGWQIYSFLAMAFFVLVLAVGFLYEWKRGGLRWD